LAIVLFISLSLKGVIEIRPATGEPEDQGCEQIGWAHERTPSFILAHVDHFVVVRDVEGHIGLTQREWLKKQLKRTELMGKTLGLIGAGNIGTELARRGIGFGMRVIAFDPLLKSHECVDLVTIEELFAESDYISLHVPLTDTTKAMINSDTIGQMKDGVVILNTARGGCVDEEDMVEALKSGKVRAYATDVWYSDPPDPNCPLYEAPNVIMTPHIGASSRENMLRIGDVVVRILEDFDQQTA
jgi:phosphoglycerate dehydrogenase-like enzyme